MSDSSSEGEWNYDITRLENGEESQEYLLVNNSEMLRGKTGSRIAAFQKSIGRNDDHEFLYEGVLREEDGDFYLERDESEDQNIPDNLKESIISIGLPAEPEQRYD